MLEWDKLLNETRRKEKYEKKAKSTGTKGTRFEIERDYGRILFATPTRRLADKTQVFPIDPSDSVRNRLTHSLEVSNLARDIGTAISFQYAEEVFGKNHDKLNVKRSVPSLLAAIGLAHDLGNPPFGHQGEVAMSTWFKNKLNVGEDSMHNDFVNFDGNPQTFRLVTKLQILNDNYGLNLTFGTLAALVKYPSLVNSNNKGGYKKFGIFESERDVIEDAWEETGLREGIRHPLTHIMEACDDIAYLVIDAEDTVKKGYASFFDLMQHLRHYKDDEIVNKVITDSEEKNALYKKEELSSSELNEVSMQMFRVFSMYHLVTEATKCFVEKSQSILNLDIPKAFELLELSKANILCQALKEFDKQYAFRNNGVLKLELVGNNYIDSTMDMLWDAISNNKTPFARYAYNRISENYRRAYKGSEQQKTYKQCQLLCDSISGMTDNYLISFHDELRPLYNGLSKV